MIRTRQRLSAKTLSKDSQQRRSAKTLGKDSQQRLSAKTLGKDSRQRLSAKTLGEGAGVLVVVDLAACKGVFAVYAFFKTAYVFLFLQALMEVVIPDGKDDAFEDAGD